jgi:hypothetical protein
MVRYLFVSLISITCAFGQPTDNTQREIVFKSVNVIPMDRERVLENQTLIVKNGKITYLGAASKAKPSADALVIDASGKYIIHISYPGYRRCTPMFLRSTTSIQ